MSLLRLLHIACCCELLPRLHDDFGIYQSPAVGLAVVGFLRAYCDVSVVDLFPMTLAGSIHPWGHAYEWQEEASRLSEFIILPRNPVWSQLSTVV